MSVQARRFTETITITGQTQSATTDYMYGIIDQIIATASVDGQSFDLILINNVSDEIFRADGVSVPDSRKPAQAMRPRVLPRGTLTVRIENPVVVSGTVTITMIEQEYA